MFILKIICPHCGKLATYTFGDGKLVDIGEAICDKDDDDEVITKLYSHNCAYCGKEFKILQVIEDGIFVSAIINPCEIDINAINNKDYLGVQNIPCEYSYNERFNMAVGEETRLIPSQWNIDIDIESLENINLFDLEWLVLERYKVLNSRDEIVERIYKICIATDIKNKDGHRLLVIKNNHFPTLKIVDWNPEFKNWDDVFYKYQIPKECELVICST